MIRILPLILVVVLVAGCASTPATPRPEFNPAEADYAVKPGDSRVEGSGLLRQRGGDVVTCAGRTVWLVPNVPFFAWGVENEELAALESEFVRTTACDAQGFFYFDSVAAGRYFVGTTITWEIPTDNLIEIAMGLNIEGGNVFVPVVVGPETVQNVVVTR